MNLEAELNWKKYDEYIIWGGDIPDGEIDQDNGAIGKLHRFLVNESAWHKVKLLVDGNKDKYGKMCYGIEIRDPYEIKKYPGALIIINSISYIAIESRIHELGFDNPIGVVPCYYFHQYIGSKYDYDEAYDVMHNHIDEIHSLYDITDKRTNDCINLVSFLREKRKDDIYPTDFYGDIGVFQDYFCDNDVAPKGDLTYVDVGAYVGDSIQPLRCFFGDSLKKIYAFEPAPDSRDKLSLYIQQSGLSDNTVIYPYLLGDAPGSVRFSVNGVKSVANDQGEIECRIMKFDDLNINDIVGTLCIKMDIEGSEISALNGMKETIREHHPYIAACIYHKVSDILEIPKLIKSLGDGYKFYIRGGLHLECWAVPV